MAFEPRTIDEIFTELLVEKQTLSSLNGLVDGGITDENSLITALANSKVAEWILWLYSIATQIHLTELRTVSAVEDIDNTIATKNSPVEQWYIDQALLFQFDGNLVIDPDTYKAVYDPIVESEQIIESCSTLDYSNTLTLKVKRHDTDILSTAELTQFTTYISKIKVAGTQIAILNVPGDLFTLNMDIVYNGSLIEADIQSDVEDAINTYLGTLDSKGTFYLNSLIDVLQAVDGVLDPRFNSGTATDANTIETALSYEYETYAGWAKEDPSNPFSSTITYIPKTV